jgi:glycosyltransferase involved in cell wall biosynthesis
MAKVFVHASAAVAGGGLTYVKNVLPRLAAMKGRHEWHVLLDPTVARMLSPQAGDIRLLSAPAALRNPLRRVWFDQVHLRGLLKKDRFDVIVATGNFGLLAPPVPQILLSRNPLYFSERHCLELRRRRLWKEYAAILAKRWLALACIRASAFNVPPTAAFQNHIARFGRVDPRSFRPIHHGFDARRFHGGDAQLNSEYRRMLGETAATRRILFVSHYNYFRNFETVLRAVAELRKLHPGPFQLVLTTRLGEGVFEHRYDTTYAARLVKELGIEANVVMLGHVPYEQLAPLYRACDLAVCPSYAETFGHPMVEAMSCGLPIVATDMDIHREICRDAGVHFDVFDPADLARKIASILGDAALARRLGDAGLKRSADFSWDKHVQQLVALIDEAAALKARPAAARSLEAAR